MDPKEKPFKFVVRLPLSLRHQIGDAAKYYRRSINSEIVARLEQSFSGILAEVNESDVNSPVFTDLESLFARRLSHNEETLVRAFRRMPEEKQAAILELLT
ncbi:MAG: Arc family DNA-binding protein [Pseudomonadota bacterium]